MMQCENILYHRVAKVIECPIYNFSSLVIVKPRQFFTGHWMASETQRSDQVLVW